MIEALSNPLASDVGFCVFLAILAANAVTGLVRAAGRAWMRKD